MLELQKQESVTRNLILVRDCFTGKPQPLKCWGVTINIAHVIGNIAVNYCTGRDSVMWAGSSMLSLQPRLSHPGYCRGTGHVVKISESQWARLR